LHEIKIDEIAFLQRNAVEMAKTRVNRNKKFHDYLECLMSEIEE
jgi:hypothetical protein